METLFSMRLKELRREHKMTQEELANKIGKTRSTIAGYETERKEPDFSTLVKLADIFNVSVDYLLGVTDNKQGFFVYSSGTVPVYFEKPGWQLLSEESAPLYSGHNTVKEKYMVFRVKDDSMINSRIFPDDLVLIKLQDEVETGKIFLLAMADGEPLLRRVHIQEGIWILQPDNPHYPPYVLKDGSRQKIKVIGRALQVKFTL